MEQCIDIFEWLPLEVIEHIEKFLNMQSLVHFYNSRNIVLTYKKLVPVIANELSLRKVKKRKFCAQCRHDAVTFIEWTPNLKRDWIPWCMLHVDPCIFNGVEFYCIGSLDINGVALA